MSANPSIDIQSINALDWNKIATKQQLIRIDQEALVLDQIHCLFNLLHSGVDSNTGGFRHTISDDINRGLIETKLMQLVSSIEPLPKQQLNKATETSSNSTK